LPYDVQYQRCLRYSYRYSADVVRATFGIGHCYSGTQAENFVKFPLKMRTIPSFSSSAATSFALWQANTTYVQGSVIVMDGTYSTSYSGNIVLTVASGLVAGNVTMLAAYNTINAYLQFDSEL